MSSYTKWDRDAYIERVGGPEEAERRRKTLMARQSGQRLSNTLNEARQRDPFNVLLLPYPSSARALRARTSFGVQMP